MRFRVGVIEVAVAILVLAALVFPAETPRVESAYLRAADEAEVAEAIPAVAQAQAELAARPSGAAADELARLLERLGQHDMALRIAGEAAERGGPDVWRAHLAVASAHAERIDIEAAHLHAGHALEACRGAGPAGCAPHDEIRLRLYVEQLDVGVQALREGLDPRLDPKGFREKIQEIHRPARILPGRN